MLKIYLLAFVFGSAMAAIGVSLGYTMSNGGYWIIVVPAIVFYVVLFFALRNIEATHRNEAFDKAFAEYQADKDKQCQ